MQYHTIKKFGGIDLLRDASDIENNSTLELRNILLMPSGAFSGPPAYERLWEFTGSIDSILSPLLDPLTDAVSLARLVNEGIELLVFWDCVSKIPMGIFFAGATPSYTGSATLSSAVATPTVVTILQKGLTRGYRWYGARFFSELRLGNGIDDNLIYQFGRTSLQLRPDGTNSKPATPTLSSVDTYTQASTLISGLGGGNTMTVTAKSGLLPGAAGNGVVIDIWIQTGSGTPAFFPEATVTRTGSNTAGDPYRFSIRANTDQSLSQLAQAVNGNSVCRNLITLTPSGSFALPNTTVSGTLSGGSDPADLRSVGFQSTVKRAYATYYDPGIDGLGYESPKSDISTAIVIKDDRKDINIAITGDTSGDLARFTKQRIYLETSPDKFNLVAEVNNVTQTVLITTATPIGIELQPDHAKAPPCSIFVYAGGKVWMSGNPTNPSRIWVSKIGTADQRAPEGCNLNFYLEVQGRIEEADTTQITAMLAGEGGVHVHTKSSITIINATTYSRRVARSATGAVNPASVIVWQGNSIPYVGADLTLYEFKNQQFYKTDYIDPSALALIRQYCKPELAEIYPGAIHLMPDYFGKRIWWWMPYQPGGIPVVGGPERVAFVYDFSAKALSGPMDFPKFVGTCFIASADSRVIGIDIYGNLFVMDLSESAYMPNNFDAIQGASPLAFSVYSGSPFGSNTTGYGKSSAGFFSYNYKTAFCTISFPFMDMGKPNKRKGFYSLEWTTIRSSRASLTVTITSDLGQQIVQTYTDTDLWLRERHKICFNISGNAITIKMVFKVAEVSVSLKQSKFAVRDVTIGYEVQDKGRELFF